MWYIEGQCSHHLWECVKTRFCEYLTKEQVQRLVNADNMWEEARTLGLRDEHCEPCAISKCGMMATSLPPKESVFVFESREEAEAALWSFDSWWDSGYEIKEIK